MKTTSGSEGTKRRLFSLIFFSYINIPAVIVLIFDGYGSAISVSTLYEATADQTYNQTYN